MVVRAGQRSGEQRGLDLFVAGRQREAHLAGEGGAGFAAGVEGGVAETGGGGREADVGGGGERGEEGLLGGVVETVGDGAAELETAVGGSCRGGGFGCDGGVCGAPLPRPLPQAGGEFQGGGCER